MILDLFAGPGGWEEGLRLLGVDPRRIIGIEMDRYACSTAVKAGFLRWEQDVLKSDDDIWHLSWSLQGLLASPPCPAFSQGGKGHGNKEAARRAMLDHIYECGNAGQWIDPPNVLCHEDARADLTLQPFRWALNLNPEWMAFEQVPQVATHWYAMCEVLRRRGYSADSRVVNFADYGLPQFRERAILLARRVGEVRWPQPTHEDLRHHDTMFMTLAPWMAIKDVFPHTTMEDCETTRRPAATLTGGGGKDNGTGIFLDKNYRRRLREALDRPKGGVLAPFEAGILQGFRANYPWTGPLGDQYMQIGNAMPPTMAQLFLRQFLET